MFVTGIACGDSLFNYLFINGYLWRLNRGMRTKIIQTGDIDIMFMNVLNEKPWWQWFVIDFQLKNFGFKRRLAPLCFS